MTNPPPEVDKLVAKLTGAVHNGDIQLAMDSVLELSIRKLKLNISISKDERESNLEKEFSVTVNVEDRETSGTTLDLFVRSTDSIADLKRKMWLNYNIPKEVQRWIIGKKVPDDETTLRQCGVCSAGHNLFLYVITACNAGFKQQELESGSGGRFKFDTLENSLILPNMMSNTVSHGEQGKELDMLLMTSNISAGLSPQTASGINVIESKSQNAPPPIPIRSPFQFNGYNDPEETQKVDTHLMRMLPLIPKVVEKKPLGWYCSRCTYLNLPTRPGCKMCTSDRPGDYTVPEDYEMTDEELAMKEQQDELEKLTRQNHEQTLLNNFNQWLQLDNLELIQNTEAFTCSICFDDFEPGEGITLRECLHQFCKDCLQGAVTYSEEPSLKCPYQDEVSKCDSILQEREIRALVPEEIFIKYLQRGLDQAESQAANSFHCKSTNCKGWCLYEDEVNFFICPICRKENCLTCKVIHQGMNCKEYQADLALKAINDDAARKTQQLIQEMVNDGTAMHCPQCRIIVQKKDGCDWLKCSVCKVEICWVTKGPRWGPKGNGDTSGGCRCGENGRCHPNCANCH